MITIVRALPEEELAHLLTLLGDKDLCCWCRQAEVYIVHGGYVATVVIHN